MQHAEYLFRILRMGLIALLLSGIIMTSYGQKIFILEKPGIKNRHYHEGDNIRLKTNDVDKIISEKITSVGDTAIILDRSKELSFSEINCIYKERAGYIFFCNLFATAGIAYFSIDLINNMITSDKPYIRTSTVIASGSMLAVAGALYPFLYRKCIIAKGKWRIKSIDPDKFLK